MNGTGNAGSDHIIQEAWHHFTDDGEDDAEPGGGIGGGFDLARGFQPIGSFTSTSSQPRQLGPVQQRQESHIGSGSAAAARATS